MAAVVTALVVRAPEVKLAPPLRLLPFLILLLVILIVRELDAVSAG